MHDTKDRQPERAPSGSARAIEGGISAAGARRRRANRTRNILLLVVGGVLVLGALAFIVSSSLEEAVYYYTVSEMRDKGDSLIGERFRVKGEVVPRSLVCEEGTTNCSFDISHEGEVVRVHSTAPLPEAFQDGVEVVALGTLSERERFEASEVTTKCPSKYEEQ